MKISTKSGAILAAAAAALLANAAVPAAQAASDYSVKCFGLNACKGNGSCKTLGNACKGHNACKGQGITMMKKSKCLAKGGSTSHG
jgi:uncharacterized membrane protein